MSRSVILSGRILRTFCNNEYLKLLFLHRNQLLVFLHGEKELGSAAVSGQTVEWAVPKEHQSLLRVREITQY